MQRVFVVNRRAGGGVSQGRLARIERYFRQRTGSFEAIVSGSEAETTSRTRRALQQGAEQIVAVGGDGTMNAALQGFFLDGQSVQPEASLALAPIGTGSDYFRTVVGDARCDWREVVLHPDPRAVDVGLVRREENGSQRIRYFLNMSSYGLSAEVVQLKERMGRWLPRQLRYVVPTLINYLHVRPWCVDLQLDGQRLQRRLLSVNVAKGIFAGGGMRFGGQVALDDGRLEVTLFHPLSLAKLIAKTHKLYRGDFAGESAVEKFQAREVTIRSDHAMLGECDGEVLGTGDATVSLVPRGVRVCFPACE